MKLYKIKPNSGHPYTGIKLSHAHVELGKPSPAQRGEVLLNVLHTNGVKTPLSFKKEEVEEVK